jgi:hypothetical protein
MVQHSRKETFAAALGPRDQDVGLCRSKCRGGLSQDASRGRLTNPLSVTEARELANRLTQGLSGSHRRRNRGHEGPYIQWFGDVVERTGSDRRQPIRRITSPRHGNHRNLGEVFSEVLQNRQSTGPGNHQIDDRADWGILALGDGSVTCLGKLGLEACLFEMIGNNSLDGIIRLDQQNSIIPLRNAHKPNWTRTWLMVNRKFFCQLNFYHFDNHSNLMPIIRRNAL